MDRALRLMTFWNWLPTFRAVAETEHLGRASEAVGISTPALSRTVSLLEEALGVELLVREGRGLRLTEAGRLLQGAVRDAMRTVHEATERLQQSEFVGRLRISSVSPATELFLSPALRTFLSEHPEVSVEWVHRPWSEVHKALQKGELDVALLRSPLSPEGISVAPLGSIPTRLFASKKLRLPTSRSHSWSSLACLPQIALSADYGEDPYPASLARQVVLSAPTFAEAAKAASDLGALVLLPGTTCPDELRRLELVALKTPPLPPLRPCVAWRTPLGVTTPSDALVAALLGTCAAAGT